MQFALRVTFYILNGRPGKIIANARSATAIHRGALPLMALTSAMTRARIARTELIDMDDFPLRQL
jgi:hypothetical protein